MPKFNKKKEKQTKNEYPSVLSFLKQKKSIFISNKIQQQTDQAQLNENAHELIDEGGGEINASKVEEDLNKKSVVAEKNLKHAKKLLRYSSGLLLEKDIKIKQLMKRNNENNAISNGILFAKHASTFEPEELKIIRSSKPGIRNDSNFILNIMRALYKGSDLKKLENRTATGRKYNGNEKREISFEKRDVIEDMFKERLTDEEQENMDESCKRFKKLNDFIRSAIHNILRREKGQLKRTREEDDGLKDSVEKTINLNATVPHQVNK